MLRKRKDYKKLLVEEVSTVGAYKVSMQGEIEEAQEGYEDLDKKAAQLGKSNELA